MQAKYVLPKVVRTWPDLVLLGAVRCSTHERFANVDLVNALLVSIQVVLGGKTRLPVATWFLALERFLMAKFVFTVPRQSLTDEAETKIEHTCTLTCS